MNPNLCRDAILILTDGHPTVESTKECITLFEDVVNPEARLFLDRLYDDIISKKHIDFDDIPNSKGDIQAYKGTETMVEVLNALDVLSDEYKSAKMKELVSVVNTTIQNLTKYKIEYMKGFQLRNEYIMLEYNTFVYTTIQATTTLLYEFVDYTKRPDRSTIEVTLKNNTARANLFYIEQLRKYNNVVSGNNYGEYLRTLLNKGRENFFGTETLVGMGTVALIAASIVPITRTLVYQFYHLRSNLSDALAQQAYFLEMNKVSINSNTQFSAKKKQDILRRQDDLIKKLIKVSDVLKVRDARSIDNTNKTIATSNKKLTLDKVQRLANNSELRLM